ncbi:MULTISPECIES: hypothetical protein [Nocardia]|uniref:hypothetical protein n=1 Tax=Nocardia TaxID=1817 RepID=UPI0024572E6D|nr:MULTISPECIES: hypothetical protein [Nocardia]
MSVTTTPVDFGQALYILNGGVEVEYKNGMYVCTRRYSGKGGSIEFSPFGGLLYSNGERVGTIYLDDTDTAEYHTPYWSMDIKRRCECGHTEFLDSRRYELPTVLETIVDATYMFVC